MSFTVEERLEKALSALRRCEERSLAGHFALEVMHEIRNPLDAIGNLVHLATLSGDVSTAVGYLRDAQEQIAIIHQIAGQSLTVARAEQSPLSVNLMELVDASLRVHDRRMKSKKVKLARDLGSSELVTVRPGEIVQVLSNLIGNSLDAIQDEGTLAFRTRKRGDKLVLLVADSRHGISYDNLGRLFEPFFTTKNDAGNGLGLVLSKKIVDRHGGRISVRSSTRASRSGTTFRICLPLAS